MLDPTLFGSPQSHRDNGIRVKDINRGILRETQKGADLLPELVSVRPEI